MKVRGRQDEGEWVWTSREREEGGKGGLEPRREEGREGGRLTRKRECGVEL